MDILQFVGRLFDFKCEAGCHRTAREGKVRQEYLEFHGRD